jgi:polysaccharide chain length determinant protein (PEP-CTERM system associated)
MVPNLDERLRVANTLLTSDTLIGRVATRLGLVTDPNADLPGVIQSIRGDIDVKVSGLESLRLSLRGRDPQRITRIANELASEFIQENLAYSARVVSGTSGFLTEQRRASEAVLLEQESRIKRFQEQYKDEMPEFLDLHLRRLERVQSQLETVSRDLRETSDKVLALERERAAMAPTLKREREGRSKSALATRLEELQSALIAATAQYSERHPEVQSLRREIREVTSRLTAESLPGAKDLAAPSGDLDPPNHEYTTLVASLDAVRARIQELESDRARLLAEERGLRARIDHIPTRAKEWAELTRDYEGLKERQRDLLKKSLDLDLSQKVEGSRREGKFRVLDPAVVPTAPIRPRPYLLMLLAAVISAILAVAAAWFVDRVIDTSFHSARAAEDALGLPVLAVVPTMASRTRRILR